MAARSKNSGRKGLTANQRPIFFIFSCILHRFFFVFILFDGGFNKLEWRPVMDPRVQILRLRQIHGPLCQVSGLKNRSLTVTAK